MAPGMVGRTIVRQDHGSGTRWAGRWFRGIGQDDYAAELWLRNAVGRQVVPRDWAGRLRGRSKALEPGGQNGGFGDVGKISLAKNIII